MYEKKKNSAEGKWECWSAVCKGTLNPLSSVIYPTCKYVIDKAILSLSLSETVSGSKIWCLPIKAKSVFFFNTKTFDKPLVWLFNRGSRTRYLALKITFTHFSERYRQKKLP